MKKTLANHTFIRSSRTILFTFLYVVLLATFIYSPASALTGQVINKTLNQPQPNVEVSYVRHAAGDVSIVRDTTNSKGQFTLEVPADPGADPPPMLLARYNNIDYPGNPAPAGDSVEIPVFETTESDSALSIASHHIIIDTQQNTVTYIVITHNHGDRTYLTGGSHGHGLEMRLPDGVTEILNAPQGVHLHGSVLVDPRPIIPGNSQTFFTFPVPNSNSLHHTTPYATNNLDVLVQPPNSEVTVTGLQDRGPVSLGENSFHRWSASGLAAGAHIGVQITSPSAVASLTADPQTLPWVLGASAVVVAMFAAVIYMRSKTPPASAPPTAPPAEPTAPVPTPTAPAPTLDRRTVLLEQIASLDERYENNELSEEDYNARRNALKAEVIDLDKEQ